MRCGWVSEEGSFCLSPPPPLAPLRASSSSSSAPKSLESEEDGYHAGPDLHFHCDNRAEEKRETLPLPWIPPRDGQSRRVRLEREHLLRPVEANCISHSGNAFMSHIARSRSIVVTARSKEDQSKIGTAPPQQRGRKGETREEGSVDRQRKGMWKWRSLIQLVSRSVLRILLLLFRLHPLYYTTTVCSRSFVRSYVSPRPTSTR